MRDALTPSDAEPPADPVARADLVAARERRLDAHLADAGREAVWFLTPGGFRWAAGGGTNVVSRDGDGVAALGYAGDGDWRVVTDNIEGERVAAEEAPTAATVAEFPWHEGDLRAAVAEASPTPAAADVDVPGLDALDPASLRTRLVPGDVERYRALGATAAAAVEGVCRRLDPADTEREAARAVGAALAARDVAAPVVLVGGSERARRYRHFTPRDAPLDGYAVVSVTAEWRGLYASLTRTVAFDPPDWLAERQAACRRVEASALAAAAAVADDGDGGAGTGADGATARPGAAAVFDSIAAAYADAGVPDEWRAHHQGGATGYAGREWFVRPDLDRPVVGPGAFAFNPTIRGAKSEDTALVDGDGLEVLTRTGEWPTATARAVDRDATVERHAALHPDAA